MVTSVLALAGVLSAGAATTLVNARILGSAEGAGATETNHVELVEAPRLIGPPPVTTALVTVPATTPPTTTEARPRTAPGPAELDETSVVDASAVTLPTATEDPSPPATPSTSRHGDSSAREPAYGSTTAGTTRSTVARATAPTDPATVPTGAPVTTTPSTTGSSPSTARPTTTSTSDLRQSTWPRHRTSTSQPRWLPDD